MKRRKCNFMIVRCVASGDGFNKGEYYASVGTNNGVQILRENNIGDCYVALMQTGGIGKGIYNAWDDSGKPSFDPVTCFVDPRGVDYWD